MKKMKRWIGLTGLFGVCGQTIALATIGLAEWEISTPGGNRIGSTDPWKERHGVCLLSAGDQGGLRYGRDDEVYVSHIVWWRYLEGYVIGNSQKGFFLFNEQEKTSIIFKREDLLAEHVKELDLGEPISEKLNPLDGWNMTWGPILKSPPQSRQRGQGFKGTTDER